MNLDVLSSLDPASPDYATQFVDTLLAAAVEAQVSDVHLHPTEEGLDVRVRLDGVLKQLGCFAIGETTHVINRLKVLGELLTYRTDVPQEGRIRSTPHAVEMRVSTFPTLHGERAVIRVFVADHQLLYLDQLGFPADVLRALQRLVAETSGALIIAGPAGSGKTTTAYAILRELVQSSEGQRNIMSMEDPIEVAVNGVAQSQVNTTAGFDLSTGLRSLLRQDPEVMMIGEIRDRDTATIAYQASLTGHLVVSTFHAGSAATAINRLSDMGIEPYLLRSGTVGILCQRLVRRLCECAESTTVADELLGLPVTEARRAKGCPQCSQTGYHGRIAVTELLAPSADQVGRAILSRDDAPQLESRARELGMKTIWERSLDLLQLGQTSPAEIRRVMGFSQLDSA